MFECIIALVHPSKTYVPEMVNGFDGEDHWLSSKERAHVAESRCSLEKIHAGCWLLSAGLGDNTVGLCAASGLTLPLPGALSKSNYFENQYDDLPEY